MSIITIGIDLAKNIFTVHGVNQSGKAGLVKPKVPRDQLLQLIEKRGRIYLCRMLLGDVDEDVAVGQPFP